MQKSKWLFFQEDVFARKIIIIASIILEIFILSACSTSKQQLYSPEFVHSVPTKEALDSIKKYRRQPNLSIYKKTKFVWYDADAIRSYMKDTLPKLESAMGMPNDSCKLVIGFYFMRKRKDSSKIRRNSFYVIPTIYNFKEKKIYDFCDSNAIYKDKGVTSIPIAYDAGQMYP